MDARYTLESDSILAEINYINNIKRKRYEEIIYTVGLLSYMFR
jgi:hypothetical protein